MAKKGTKKGTKRQKGAKNGTKNLKYIVKMYNNTKISTVKCNFFYLPTIWTLNLQVA